MSMMMVVGSKGLRRLGRSGGGRAGRVGRAPTLITVRFSIGVSTPVGIVPTSCPCACLK